MKSHIWSICVLDLFWQTALITCANSSLPVHLETEIVPREQWLISIVCHGRVWRYAKPIFDNPSCLEQINPPLLTNTPKCLSTNSKVEEGKQERREEGREGWSSWELEQILTWNVQTDFMEKNGLKTVEFFHTFCFCIYLSITCLLTVPHKQHTALAKITLLRLFFPVRIYSIFPLSSIVALLKYCLLGESRCRLLKEKS